MTVTLNPSEAWQALPASEWNADTARHLLRRTGWTARPAEIERATREGLAPTLARLFPSRPTLLDKPRLVERLEGDGQTMAKAAQKLTGEDRLRAQRELQERGRQAINDLSIKWLQLAATPESDAYAKWVLFLSDVYVVSAEKVRSAALIYEHFDILARHGLGPAPELTKSISRSPAMVIYLDLNQSQRKAPNENFARELFELFVLGEGHYSEKDIKEAARAFTGYRAQQYSGGDYRYIVAQHDATPKTVFGHTGPFSGDDVIDLAYTQKAASTFLPRELARFYLTEEALPAEHIDALGAAWQKTGYSLRGLATQFFSSRLFYAPEFRGNFIKSPIQFYIGLVQDLQLEVTPLPRYTVSPLRQMGQLLFYPPNVRGWVGGRTWINSATLGARRQLVESLFTPIDERNLNADEQIDLVAARSNGITAFTVGDERFAPLLSLDAWAASQHLIETYLAAPVAREYSEGVRKFIEAGPPDEKQRLRRLRRAAVTLLQTPEYQLC